MHASQNIVIVVDDSDAQRFAISGLLENNFECISLKRGEDVLENLQEGGQRIKACVLDLTLAHGEMTGLDTLRQIREIRPTLPVLVFTGQDSFKAKEEAYKAGATLFMPKPYENHDLIAAINAMILMHSLRENVDASEREIETLQTALDAINVEVEISDPAREITIANAKSRGEATQAWAERLEGDRTVWFNSREAVSPSGRKLLVTTRIDVTRRKLLDSVRHRLLQLARTSPQQILDFVANFLHKQFGYKRVRCYLGSRREMPLVSWEGMDEDATLPEKLYPVDHPSCARVFSEYKPFLLKKDELENDPCKEVFKKHLISTQLQIPLVSAAGFAGVISVDDGDGKCPLTLEDVDLLASLGSMVADSIQVAKLLRETERERVWWQGLNEIDRPLAEGGSLKDVLDTLRTTVSRLTNADASVIFVRLKQADPLRVISANDVPGRGLFTTTHDGHGMIGQCLKTRQLVFEKNVWLRPGFQQCFDNYPECAWKEFLKDAKSVLVQPICCGEDVIGVLFLRWRTEYTLNDKDREFLSVIASRVAIALAKLHNSQRLEQSVIQQSKLHALGMLTAGVAHGMRNPLAILQHSLDHLKMRLEQAEVDLDRTTLLLDIRGMEVEAQRSLKTLERLVRWARPHGGLPEPTRLQVIIHDLVELISGDLIHMRISLALAIDRNLPCVLLAADPLRMALTDLFWNAAKAMPSGGEIRVTLTESADHRFVVLSVEDSGVGMTESQIQSLFSTNPFEPIPAGGIGLGLYLCKQVLAAQGVTIRAQSELGAGTKVFVDFPVHTVPEEV